MNGETYTEQEHGQDTNYGPIAAVAVFNVKISSWLLNALRPFNSALGTARVSLMGTDAEASTDSRQQH